MFPVAGSVYSLFLNLGRSIGVPTRTFTRLAPPPRERGVAATGGGLPTWSVFILVGCRKQRVHTSSLVQLAAPLSWRRRGHHPDGYSRPFLPGIAAFSRGRCRLAN